MSHAFKGEGKKKIGFVTIKKWSSRTLRNFDLWIV
jgi:hypothetical protein